MPAGFFKKLFGGPDDRTIARFQKTAQVVNALEPKFQALPADAARDDGGAPCSRGGWGIA